MARTLPRSFVENYTSQLHNLTEIAQSKLAGALASLNVDSPNFRSSVAALFEYHARVSAEAAAEIATAFYRGASAYLTGIVPEVEAISGFESDAAYAAAYAIEDSTASQADMTSQLGRALGYQINSAAGRASRNCGRQDKRRPRFARVPTGTETCAWCISMAGLGFHYITEETASHTHSGCDCRIVPSWSGSGIEGYDSTEYRDLWRDANYARTTGDIPDEVQERIDRARDRARADGKPWTDDLNGTEIVMRWMYGMK